MRASRHHAIRQVLQRQTDGVSVSQICKALSGTDMRESAVRRALSAMPDVYIDRWERGDGRGGKYRAVYCAVPIPDDCPHPLKQQETP